MRRMRLSVFFRFLLLLCTAGVHSFVLARAQQNVTPPPGPANPAGGAVKGKEAGASGTPGGQNQQTPKTTPSKSKVPSIASVYPQIEAAGSTVTITGTNFGTDKKNITVIFNGTSAEISRLQPGMIVTVVPNRATTGDIVVISSAGPSKGAKFTIVPCAAGSLKLKFLETSDAVGLAELLENRFPNLRIDAGLGTDGKPDGTVCVRSRATNATIARCDPSAPAGSVAKSYCAVQDVVTLADRDEFKGAKLGSTFFIRVSREPGGLSADRVAKAFPHPSPLLDLQKISASDLLLVPSPAAITQGAGASDLAKQAAGINEDLRALDDLYFRAYADSDLQAKIRTIQCQKDKRAIQDAEVWIGKYTVQLSSLLPRDVALLLVYDPWRFETRAFGQAVTLLPIDPSKLRDCGAYIEADAIERDLLFRLKQKQDASPKQPAKDTSSPKPAAPQTTTVTTKSTTKTSTSANGKTTTAPVTTVSTETTTTNQPPADAAPQGSPSANTPSPADGPSTSDTATIAEASAPDSSVDSSSNDSSGQGKSDKTSGAKVGGAKTSPTASNTSTPKANPADALTTSFSQQSTLRLDSVVRLYHLRQANEIAKAINAVSTKDNPLVQPLDDNGNNDLLMILPSPVGGKDHTTDIKRAIAMLDLPRPQVSLQVWSYQISQKVKGNEPKDQSKASLQIQDTFGEIRDTVNTGNAEMTAALSRGLEAIFDVAQSAQSNGKSFFNPEFYGYVTERYDECLEKDVYCLGYYDALKIPQPYSGGGTGNASLSRLLLFLAAVGDNQASSVVESVVSKMEDGHECAKESPPGAEPPLCFPGFRKQLQAFASPRNLHVLRSGILDFLFEYKWTIVYPDDFIPYNLQRTAHVVDSLFTPVTDAFNQDLDTYVINRLKSVEQAQNKKATGLSAFGSVQVSAISGTKASVNGKVNNYFDITPPQSLNDILNVDNQKNLASNLKTILTPKEILMVQALANIGTQPRITAQISKETKLTVTPITLDTASSAEFDIDFDVSEPSPPETVNQKTAAKDLLDRVAEHHVTSHVRVDALKLFQVSAFTMELTHPYRGTPVPIVGQVWEGIFGTMPGVDRLFRLPPYSKTQDNRSVAIVRAVVVPTAMDLGLSLPFLTDRVYDPVTDTTDLLNAVSQAGGTIRRFHNRVVACMLQGEDCSDVKLSTTPEDLRDPTTP
jgi:hypothetical protein